MLLVERKGALKTNPLTLAPRVRTDRHVSFGDDSIHEIEADNEGRRVSRKWHKYKKQQFEDEMQERLKLLRRGGPYRSSSGDDRFSW